MKINFLVNFVLTSGVNLSCIAKSNFELSPHISGFDALEQRQRRRKEFFCVSQLRIAN